MPIGDIGDLNHSLVITCWPTEGEVYEIGDPVDLVGNYKVSKKSRFGEFFGQIYNVHKETVEVTVRGVCRFKYKIKPTVCQGVHMHHLDGDLYNGSRGISKHIALSIDEEKKTVDVLLG